MKKVHLLWVAVAMMLTACSDNRLTISGMVEREVDSLAIAVMLNDNSDTLLAKIPVTDGAYMWEGTADSACIIRVYYGKDQVPILRRSIDERVAVERLGFGGIDDGPELRRTDMPILTIVRIIPKVRRGSTFGRTRLPKNRYRLPFRKGYEGGLLLCEIDEVLPVREKA